MRDPNNEANNIAIAQLQLQSKKLDVDRELMRLAMLGVKIQRISVAIAAIAAIAASANWIMSNMRMCS